MATSLLVITGSFRNELAQLIKNIECAQRNFLPTKTIIVSDSPHNLKLPFEQFNISFDASGSTQNGYSIVSALYFYHIQFILKQLPSFNSIIIMRNDITLRLNQHFSFPHSGVWVLPRPWWNLDKNALTNTHLYILSYLTFMQIDFCPQRICELAKTSWDTEHLFSLLLKPTTLIPLVAIDFYQLDGNTKFIFDSNGLRDTTFPLSWSFLHPASAPRAGK